MLVYQEVPEGTITTGALVGLHGRGGDLDQLAPLARELAGIQLIAPQAPRPVSPITQGDAVGSGGFTWFFIQDVGRPEPATFGESLWLVEQFVLDVREREPPGRPIVLAGFEQGAVLAVTLAAVVPEALAGVAAICGYLPDIFGWTPPIEDLGALPILLVHDPDDAEIPLALVESTVEELRRRHAVVTGLQVPGARLTPIAAASVLKKWVDALISEK
jgi:phospholipase/carboxylesterase